jgi:hypothetical protein
LCDYNESIVVGTNVYSVCVEKHHFQKLAESILKNKDQDLSSNPAVRHGILSEEICRRRYVNEQNKSEFLFTQNIYMFHCLQITFA